MGEYKIRTTYFGASICSEVSRSLNGNPGRSGNITRGRP